MVDQCGLYMSSVETLRTASPVRTIAVLLALLLNDSVTGDDDSVKGRPVESHSGARETLSWGPHNLIPYAPRSKRQRRKRKETGGVSPHHLTRGLGERRPKMDFMHISGQKVAIWNTLLGILSDGGPPKCREARENFPLSLPPLDGPD